MATWRELIADQMKKNGEDWNCVVSHTFDDGGLDVEFYDGFGGTNGEPFTLWTGRRVYFPICYDGAEWCGSAPRNPCSEKTSHQGGG